jgi:hypothetical protein
MNILFFVARIKYLSFVFQVPSIAFSAVFVQNPVQSMGTIIQNERYLSFESKCRNSLFGRVVNMKKFRIKSEGKQLISNDDNCLLF